MAAPGGRYDITHYAAGGKISTFRWNCVSGSKIELVFDNTDGVTGPGSSLYTHWTMSDLLAQAAISS